MRLLASTILISSSSSLNHLSKKPKSLWKITLLQWMIPKTLSSFCYQWLIKLTSLINSSQILSWWSTRYSSRRSLLRSKGKSLRIFLPEISSRISKWKCILWFTRTSFKLWPWGQRRSISKRSWNTYKKNEQVECVSKQLLDQIINIGIDQKYPTTLGKIMRDLIIQGDYNIH